MSTSAFDPNKSHPATGSKQSGEAEVGQVSQAHPCYQVGLFNANTATKHLAADSAIVSLPKALKHITNAHWADFGLTCPQVDYHQKAPGQT